jgi:hypothetical protein
MMMAIIAYFWEAENYFCLVFLMLYSIPPLIKQLHMQSKIGLTRDVASFEVDHLFVVVFYYLSASEVWPDK